MEKIKKYALALALTIGAFSCNQEGNIEPELTFLERLELFNESYIELSKFYTGRALAEALVSSNKDLFETIEINNEIFNDNFNGRAECEEVSTIFTYNGKTYMSVLDCDGCLTTYQFVWTTGTVPFALAPTSRSCGVDGVKYY